MLLMESYMFCASLRLGVIIISAFALVKSCIIIYIIATYGIGFMLTVIAHFDTNLSYRASYYMVRDAICWMEQYPKTVTLILQVYSIGHVMSCIVAAYGAYKLKRNFVVPLAIFEFSYFVEVVTLFTLFLRILRHFLHLSQLIMLTITATFYAILVLYDFLALVAFEQVLRLVMSERYQELYGTDPFNPVLMVKPNAVKAKQQLDVRPTLIYVTPKMDLQMRPKWWQVENTEVDVKNDAGKYFQSRELLPDSAFLFCVLLILGTFMLILRNINELTAHWQCSEAPHGLLRQHGDYWVWHDYMPASNKLSANESITLTTHGTHMDLSLLFILVDRWRAPISLSLYACGSDFDSTMEKLGYLHGCAAQGKLLRRYVSIHLVFDTRHKPVTLELYRLSWQHVPYNCAKKPLFEIVQQEFTYWYTNKMKYPVNLLRNVARYNAKTYYIMALDLQLLPSAEFVKEFMHYNWRNMHTSHKSIFCLPTFGHKVNAPLAQNKKKLLKILQVYNITNPSYGPQDMQRKWLNTIAKDDALSTFNRSSTMDMCVGYVSINELEPLYDERCEMESIYDHGTNLKASIKAICLNYTFITLDGAFLIRRTVDSWRNIDTNKLKSSPETVLRLWTTWHQFYDNFLTPAPAITEARWMNVLRGFHHKLSRFKKVA
ncbi:hypothetical protein KR222_009334 [Zaprionus bogoriensis]|nr:hypothetical protein KR222_009334 [Zaprionus bogoriensis]